MSSVDQLANIVRAISAELQKNIRVDPNDSNQAGWGQFVDAPIHAHQIGPYGTCAGLLALTVGNPQSLIDGRVTTQIETFWSGGAPNTKLYEQNIRLAFMVLSLARVTDIKLSSLRDSVAQELRLRQLPDGSWGDWRSIPNFPSHGRPETTAWIVLALGRLNPTDQNAIKGAEYLAAQLVGTARLSVISPIAVAAAINYLPSNRASTELRNQALSLVETIKIDNEERISFFDYVKQDSGLQMARDYLCFPAFYPLSVIINGLLKNANPLELVRLAVARSSAIEDLAMMISNSGLYKLPGASFSATVDQSMIALTFEQFQQEQRSIGSVISFLRPIGRWTYNSWIIRLILPLAVLTFAIIALQSPKAAALDLQAILHFPVPKLVKYADTHPDRIQFAVAILYALFPQLPKSCFDFIRGKIGF